MTVWRILEGQCDTIKIEVENVIDKLLTSSFQISKIETQHKEGFIDIV